jgi:hypothetical protein
MELEKDPEGWGPRASSPWLWRWLWLPVDFWRAMEVIGLWTAAVVGLLAIYYSTRDAREQVETMRGQLRTMSGQLDEMQQEGRPWVGPIGVALVSKDRNEPLRLTLSYRNFGRQPATLVASPDVV